MSTRKSNQKRLSEANATTSKEIAPRRWFKAWTSISPLTRLWISTGFAGLAIFMLAFEDKIFETAPKKIIFKRPDSDSGSSA
ncbi:hypothetical protein H4R33_000458 [Dimargaris cristalligena]|uniref:Uncharacterized protein n=1 Tax=Dimargaris cristalligena TaxID=215637 RepID=A0A4P9ZTP7_9FUNG|nr:hypothetical protein H4R33_000458 [Dimargaris cristalligena]RKP36211.1 hypothetical protein BJ085DRAFT_35902 [Dimargaris cristalligena]|eukprot:RKP36211.1 hypothetical protein BJ085DRAFT_35902 [Dimargaris cristalligena]